MLIRDSENAGGYKNERDTLQHTTNYCFFLKSTQY